ncbi:MAG: uracil-DNA glycosylase [Pseudomonadota bacterium]
MDPDSLKQWPPDLGDLDAGWAPLVKDFLVSSAGQSLSVRLADALCAGKTVYPPEPFRALTLTPFSQVRVVILGQDPYHGPGQAEGLAFSVARGVRVPPSLRNIFKELQQSLGVAVSEQGSLTRWAKQGVLLLNTCLTVEAGQPASHARWGWEVLTDQLVAAVANNPSPVVFMLWGAQAQAKKQLIDAADLQGRHLILQANHPSPLSAMRPPVPFLGCGHFVQANSFFQRNGEKPIEW